jgi:site-specific recombinase XerD
MGLPALEIEDDVFNPKKRSSPADLSLKNIFDSYIRYYAGGNDHTARAKRLDIQHFLEFLCLEKSFSKPTKLKLKDWNYTSVQRFVDKSLHSGESPSTVARRLATLKHVGRTFAEKVPGFINPAREVKAPKINPSVPKAISKPEIKLIKTKAKFRQKEKDNFNRLRNKTLLDFLLDTGLRAEEVRLLRLGQIDEKLEWIQNVRTKGRRYRNVYITSAVRPALTEYLKERELKLKNFYTKLSKSVNKQLPLFISTYNAIPAKPDTFLMGAKSIWRAVAELSADTHLHPHLLRHSYALDLLKNSKDVRLVSQALGHSDVRVTMRYTERKGEEIAEALEKSRKADKGQ